MQSIRFRHNPTEAIGAIATVEQGSLQTTYTIEYSDRRLSIVYQTSFPHAILTWEESYLSGWGKNAKELSTKGQLISRERLPYWNLNHLADSTYRINLKLN